MRLDNFIDEIGPHNVVDVAHDSVVYRCQYGIGGMVFGVGAHCQILSTDSICVAAEFNEK